MTKFAGRFPPASAMPETKCLVASTIKTVPSEWTTEKVPIATSLSPNTFG